MRRRPFRRPLRRIPQRRPGRVPPALQAANALMQRGQYDQAAEIFEKLADEAAARQHPRAGTLYLRTAQAFLAGQHPQEAVAHARRGLDLLAQAQRWQLVHRHGQRAVAALRQHNYTKEADEMQAYLRDLLPTDFQAARQPAQTGVLPAQCSGCGAPVNPREVEWLDARTAECPYCGAILHTE